MFQSHIAAKQTASVPAGHRRSAASPAPRDHLIRLSANQTVYSEGEHVLAIYQVEAGAVRIYRLMPNGHRHILYFCGEGEWFGLEKGDVRTDFAEAVCETRIRWFSADQGAALSVDLLSIALTNLAKAQRKQLVMNEQSALKRVAAFVQEMDARHPGAGEFDIMMSRGDIADYLGLTVETVARSFTKLRQRRIICLDGKLQRLVRLLDRQALMALTNLRSDSVSAGPISNVRK